MCQAPVCQLVVCNSSSLLEMAEYFIKEVRGGCLDYESCCQRLWYSSYDSGPFFPVLSLLFEVWVGGQFCPRGGGMRRGMGESGPMENLASLSYTSHFFGNLTQS